MASLIWGNATVCPVTAGRVANKPEDGIFKMVARASRATS